MTNFNGYLSYIPSSILLHSQDRDGHQSFEFLDLDFVLIAIVAYYLKNNLITYFHVPLKMFYLPVVG